jgi:RNA polymerase sigma-70 factor, ECF subfamily
MPDDSFDGLMARLRTGDQQAAARVFNRFANRLIALARARMDTRLRQKLDPEDVLQSVYRSFFARHADGQFAFEGWDGLWALLTLMTVRKCARSAERFKTGGRNVSAELSPASDDHALKGPELLARDPRPEEIVMLEELVEGLLRGLNKRDRSVVSLALQGYTPADIVSETGVPERTVYRALERARGVLNS